MTETNSPPQEDSPPAAEPWTLTVTLSWADYVEAVPTTRLWLGRPWRTITADFRPEVFQIVLTGERRDLVGQLNQYCLWLSAQIDFRPQSEVPQEHPLTPDERYWLLGNLPGVDAPQEHAPTPTPEGQHFMVIETGETEAAITAVRAALDRLPWDNTVAVTERTDQAVILRHPSVVTLAELLRSAIADGLTFTRVTFQKRG